MQRRNSTKSRGLDRRKSTSSVKSVHLQHISPEAAERDAQVAAAQAFARARERSTTDASMWPPSRGIDQPELARFNSTPERYSNGSAIRKQQSVRFVKPKPPRNSHEVENVKDSSLSRGSENMGLSTRGLELEPRPPSSASAAGMASASKGAAGDYISALITGEDYYTPEDDIASAPSSYRRIRKSRSMFTSSETSAMPSVLEGSRIHQLPMTNSFFPDLSNNEKMPPPPGLKAPKSMSFLKGRRNQSNFMSSRRGSAPLIAINDENMQSSARQGGLKSSKSAMLLRPKSSNPEKVFRKTLREVSNGNSSGDAILPKNGSLRKKARKVSQGFKHKLKSFFSLVKGENDEVVFPPQQIKAHKTHVNEIGTSEDKADDLYLNRPAAEDAALSQVASGVPSLHAVPSEQQLKSRQGSLESMRSERKVSDENSRVTSWTNSDANTFTTTNSQHGDWERKRLSVIRESGSHMVSPSARRPIAPRTRADSNDNVFGMPSTTHNAMAAVDSQRIYSALVKRLNETQSLASGIEKQRQRSIENFMTLGSVPPRSSSRDRGRRRRGTPSTIRHVSESDSENDTTRAASGSTIIHAPRSEMNPLGGSNQIPSSEKETRERLRTSSSADAAISYTRKAQLSDTCTLSARSQTSPGLGGFSHPTKTLSARSSAFFGSPTCHLFRTQSPYRRALQGSIKAATDCAAPKSPEFNPWMVSLNNLPVRCPSPCESEADERLGYEESIYSPAPEPAPGLPMDGSANTLSLVDRFPKPPSNYGDATIFVDPPTDRPSDGSEPIQRVTSTASSVEWKTWLSANVSKIEQPSPSPDSSDDDDDDDNDDDDDDGSIARLHWPSGHVRECTQICDEEDDNDQAFGTQAPEATYRTLTTIEPNIQSSYYRPRSILKNKCPTPLSDKENEAPKPPPIPLRSNLRSTPSISSIRSNNEVFKTPLEPHKNGTANSIRRKSLAHMRSLNTMGNLTKHGASTPAKAKLVKRQTRPKSCNTPMSSPGISAAVDRQFGRLDSSTDSKRRLAVAGPVESENISPEVGAADGDCDGTHGDIGADEDFDTQSGGSKRMVDLFLNSRRKRIAGSEDTGAFV